MNNLFLSVFFWVFPWRLINQTPGKYRKEYRQDSKHGKSLKSRTTCIVCLCDSGLPSAARSL